MEKTHFRFEKDALVSSSFKQTLSKIEREVQSTELLKVKIDYNVRTLRNNKYG